MITNHLTPDQLSALVDGALAARALEQAERHLAGCAACRGALAALSAQEEALKRALAHEPGEAYFAGLADRVGDRIRAEGIAATRERGAAERPRLGSSWGSPRSLAWLGAVATVVVGVGIVFLTTRETNVVPLRDTRAIERATRAAPPVPAPAYRDDKASKVHKEEAGREAPAAGAKQKAVEPSVPGTEAERNLVTTNESRARPDLVPPPPTAAPAPAGAVRPGRAQEVRRDERGEDVPVNPPSGPAALFARPPAPVTPPAAPGEPVYVRKHAPALPMKTLDQQQADKLRAAPGAPTAAPSAAGSAATSESLAESDAARPQLCGDVHDPAGRPVANASVMLAETGATTSTDGRGRFCIAASGGERTLTVLAVGFVPVRRPVTVGSAAAEVSVVLRPVAVLGGAPGKGTYGYATPSPSGAPDLLSSLPDSLKDPMRHALLLTTAAGGLNSAAAWEAAAGPWSRILAARPGGAAEPEAAFQLANARFHAWEASPTVERRNAAARAIETCLAGAQPGARREQARAWQERLGR